jgi:hypothetical protein
VVNREAKYRVTADGSIRLVYVVGQRERALLTTDAHPELVRMVQRTKTAHGEQPSGVFYLNEWRHVLVKAARGTWYAGVYDPVLRFDLDGEDISATAPKNLRPGEAWPGPRVGVRYTLAASGDDIYCRRMIAKRTERQEFLSDYVSDAEPFVRKLSSYRPTGGRIYINEAREIFSPASNGNFIYLGFAPTHLWFPEPRPEEQ